VLLLNDGMYVRLCFTCNNVFLDLPYLTSLWRLTQIQIWQSHCNFETNIEIVEENSTGQPGSIFFSLSISFSFFC